MRRGPLGAWNVQRRPPSSPSSTRRSFYEWQGETHDDAESQLVIKTRRERFEALAAYIKEHHPYDEPELIGLPLTVGSPSYLDWLRTQTR